MTEHVLDNLGVYLEKRTAFRDPGASFWAAGSAREAMIATLSLVNRSVRRRCSRSGRTAKLTAIRPRFIVGDETVKTAFTAVRQGSRCLANCDVGRKRWALRI
jgi:hypothetical protein